MKYPLKDFILSIETLLRDERLKQVVVFCSPLDKVVARVKATRRKNCPREILITFGKLNYREREFIKLCKKSKIKPSNTWLKLNDKHTARRG